MQNQMIQTAAALLREGTVARVLGWKPGEFGYDVTPALFDTPEALEAQFLYNAFCGANLSKYLIPLMRKEGKTLVFLKPCDSYSFVQLLKEHRVLREKVYAVAIPCHGMADAEVLRARGITGITGLSVQAETVTVQTLYGEETLPLEDALPDRCKTCKTKAHAAVEYDLRLGDAQTETRDTRFEGVARLEAMTPEERFAFWQGELSRCIRCNACRNVCPACSCEKCVFDNPASGVEQKAAADPFEENLFHIIRALHVAGRCTDCGECSRVCPQHIPLHLLNRKLIKDINELYGAYQAGADEETVPPLVSYRTDDAEASVVHQRGGGQ